MDFFRFFCCGSSLPKFPITNRCPGLYRWALISVDRKYTCKKEEFSHLFSVLVDKKIGRKTQGNFIFFWNWRISLESLASKKILVFIWNCRTTEKIIL